MREYVNIVVVVCRRRPSVRRFDLRASVVIVVRRLSFVDVRPASSIVRRRSFRRSSSSVVVRRRHSSFVVGFPKIYIYIYMYIYIFIYI